MQTYVAFIIITFPWYGLSWNFAFQGCLWQAAPKSKLSFSFSKPSTTLAQLREGLQHNSHSLCGLLAFIPKRQDFPTFVHFSRWFHLWAFSYKECQASSSCLKQRWGSDEHSQDVSWQQTEGWQPRSFWAEPALCWGHLGAAGMVGKDVNSRELTVVRLSCTTANRGAQGRSWFQNASSPQNEWLSSFPHIFASPVLSVLKASGNLPVCSLPGSKEGQTQRPIYLQPFPTQRL